MIKLINKTIVAYCPYCNYETTDIYNETKGQYSACIKCGIPMRLRRDNNGNVIILGLHQEQTIES